MAHNVAKDCRPGHLRPPGGGKGVAHRPRRSGCSSCYDTAVRAVVFATAGHIDHGKTSLIRALTGIDCDRLEEEKRRGITIVLGFAALPEPGGELEVSFVDVPGHERLVHTMVAGAGAVDRALLVVAADEGVMPQTREHLDVLDLLGVRGGVVALTKVDLVGAEQVELVAEEVREVLAGSALADALVVPCSALTGAGLAKLRAALLACAAAVRRREEPHRPFRLAVDRVFSKPGAGTVVTGTVRWGEVRVGDELHAVPSGHRLRVRALQVHGQPRRTGRPGERLALQLAGAAVDELPRGEQLLSAGPWRAAGRLAVRIRLLPSSPPLQEGDTVWVHLLAARTVARLERLLPAPLPPGQRGRAILRLRRSAFAAPGDRLVLRRISPARTMGGAVILDPHAPPVRRRDAERLATLPDPSADLPAALAAFIAAGGWGGATLLDLSARLGIVGEGLEAALGRVVAGGEIRVVRTNPPTFLAVARLAMARERAATLLAAAGPLGVPLAEFATRVVPPGGSALRDVYLEDLKAVGVMREVAGRAVRAGVAPVDHPLAGALERLYREAGFAAPSPAEAAARLAAEPRAVEGMVRFLIDAGRLTRLGGKWVLHRSVLDEVIVALAEWEGELVEVSRFKERFGLTRKLAIPLLEWLDSQRITRREGNARRVLPRRR